MVIVLGAEYYYRYRATDPTCPAPLSYAVGPVDGRFGLSGAGARKAVSEVETLWETATGRNLFDYDPKATFFINFIFDERQKLTVEEHTLREILDRKESVHSAMKEEYENLLAKYETLKKTYESRVTAYENGLAAHNGEVAYWNNTGGAPREVYERLNEEERALDAENIALNTLANMLNGLVDAINKLGAEGNKTVRDYNDHVADYNDRFHHTREFTQGDYYQERINIYQFKDMAELRLVLAHELGHALSLGHVEDSKSVMYYLMDKQARGDIALTVADLAEFKRVCE